MAKANTKKNAKPGIVDKAAKLSIPAMAAVLVVIALALGGGFYGLVYMPHSKQVKQVENVIKSTQKSINDQKGSLGKHQAVSNYIEPISAAYLYIQRYLPQEEEMPRLVQMVAEIASRAGLTDGVTMFAPKLPARVMENYAEIPFTMDLEGEFLTVLSFIYDFSRMDRIVNVTEIAIGNPTMVDEQRETFHVKVKCSGSTYRSLTDEEIGAAAALTSQSGQRKL